jgi:hypothetical protein
MRHRGDAGLVASGWSYVSRVEYVAVVLAFHVMACAPHSPRPPSAAMTEPRTPLPCELAASMRREIPALARDGLDDATSQRLVQVHGS